MIASSPDSSLMLRTPAEISEMLPDSKKRSPAAVARELAEITQSQGRGVAARSTLANDLLTNPDVSRVYPNAEALNAHLGNVSEATVARESWLGKGWRKTKEGVSAVTRPIGRVLKNPYVAITLTAILAYLGYRYYHDWMSKAYEKAGKYVAETRSRGQRAAAVLGGAATDPGLTNVPGSGAVFPGPDPNTGNYPTPDSRALPPTYPGSPSSPAPVGPQG
jgi:hypothetical protein